MHEFRRNSDGEAIHHDVIFDLCELTSPLLVATASIDGLVRLISLKEKRVVGVFAGHSKGVRQIDYTPYNDGYLLSAGFEAFVNVWSLEGGMGAIQSSSNLARRGDKRGRLSNLHGRLSKGSN